MMFKYVCAAVLLFCCMVQAGEEDIRYYDVVHFRGLELLNKQTIAREGGMRSQNDQIEVNMHKLDAFLADNPLVREYRLNEDDAVLTIIITEYMPKHVVYITGHEKTVFCHVDENFRIISTRLHQTVKYPVIVLDVTAIEDMAVKGKLKTLITHLIDTLERSDLADQVRQIDYSETGRVRISLNGRRTEFILTAQLPEIDRLIKTVGYLDAVQRYPSTLDIRGRIAVIR